MSEESQLSSKSRKDESLMRQVSVMAKATVGIGIVALPVAFANASLIPSIIILFVALLLCTNTLSILSKLSELNVRGYVDLGEKCWKGKGKLIVLVIQFILLLGPLTAFLKYCLQYAGDIVKYFMNDDQTIYAETQYLAPFILIFVYPLCVFKDLSGLSLPSILGLACIGYLTVLTIMDCIWDFFVESARKDGYFNFSLFSCDLKGVVTAFNTFLLSYFNHTSALQIFHEMDNPTPKRRSQLIMTTQILVFIFYILTAVFGYVHFGSELKNYDTVIAAKNDNTAYVICKILLIVVIIVTYPLIFFPLRQSLEQLWFSITGRTETGDDDKLNQESSATKTDDKWDFLRRNLIAVIILPSTMMLSLLFKNVLDIFNLFMPLVGSAILFFIPSLAYFSKRKELNGFLQDDCLAALALITGGAYFGIGISLNFKLFE